MHDEGAVRVLLVEDDEDDCVLTLDLLAEGFGSRFTMEWASTRLAGLEHLTEKCFDVALLDYNLGSETGIDLLRDLEALVQGVADFYALEVATVEQAVVDFVADLEARGLVVRA